MTQSASSVTSQPANLTPSYRRNGKLQSCEPCRKGKLRCDHALPTCGRCARRGKVDACIYHPAPLTKPRESPSLSTRGVSADVSRSPIFTTAHRSAPYPPPPARPALISPPTTEPVSSTTSDNTGFRSNAIPINAVVTTDSPQLSHSSLTRQTSISGSYPNESMSIKDTKTGYLGSSSYSAIFTENKTSLSIDPPEPEIAASPNVPIPHDKIHRGAEILSMLKEVRIFERFIHRWFEISNGYTMIRPIYAVWLRGIMEEFDSLLSQHHHVEDLYWLSALVWRNTQQSVPVNGSTSTLHWGALHTGRNLRWETVGLLCTAVGMNATDMSEYDQAFSFARARGFAKDRRTMTATMKDAMEEIISFCKYCESITDLYVCLLLESVVILEGMCGDGHIGAWQRMGEVVDTAILLGYHQERRADELTPFYVAELRTRLFDQIYGRDKSMSTFLGRPPRLSHRYCVWQLPLDLSDDELCLEGPELQAALARLNDGWNTSHRYHRSTWRRVWGEHARIREDILEIILGTGSSEGILEKAEQIRIAIQQTNNSMPDFVKADVIDILNNMHSDKHPIVGMWEKERIPNNVINLIAIHCGILHTEFLLERSIINRMKSPNSGALIPKARALLKILLAAVAKRDQLRDFSVDMSGLLSFHGLPAAGALGVELLKQEQSRIYTPDILPRSKIIQDLSVFISALSAVGPGEGNYTICNQGRRVLEKILDKVLSPEHAQPSAASSHSQSLVNDPGIYFPTGNDADFMQWLENIEWERGSLFGQAA